MGWLSNCLRTRKASKISLKIATRLRPLLSESGMARERQSAKSRRARDKWKKSASSAEVPPTVERTQFRTQELEHGVSADAVSQSRLVDYKSGRYPVSLAFSASFKRNNRLALALQDKNLESHIFSVDAFFRFTSTLVVHRASLFFQSKKSSLREIGFVFAERIRTLKSVPRVAGKRPSSEKWRRRYNSKSWV